MTVPFVPSSRSIALIVPKLSLSGVSSLRVNGRTLEQFGELSFMSSIFICNVAFDESDGCKLYSFIERMFNNFIAVKEFSKPRKKK